MAIVEVESAGAEAGRPPRMTLARREAMWGWIFISPWIIGFILLTAIPMIATLAFTFTNVRLLQEEPLRFVGLENYQEMLSDPKTWDALRVTFQYRSERAHV